MTLLYGVRYFTLTLYPISRRISTDCHPQDGVLNANDLVLDDTGVSPARIRHRILCCTVYDTCWNDWNSRLSF